MRTWNVLINYHGDLYDFSVVAASYTDACKKAVVYIDQHYPGGVIVNIEERAMASLE